MLYPRLLLVFSVLLLAVPVSLHAQETRHPSPENADAEVITFDQAVRLALQNSIEIRRAANDVALQQSSVAMQRSNLLPDLSLSLSGSRSYGQAFDNTVGQLTYEGRTGAFGGLSAGITVFDGFSSWAELRRARYSREASATNLQHQRQQVIFQVMTQYLDLFKARENVRIQEENLESARQQLQRIENQVRVGTVRTTDLHQQRSQVASAELALLQARRSAQEFEVQLIQLLQLDPFGDYRFEVPRLDENEIVPEQYELAALIEEAFNRRHDLRAREMSIQASEQAVRAARGTRFPTVSLSASMSSSYTSLGGLSFSDQFFERNRNEGVSLSISLPLFDGFQRRNQVRQATIERDNARLNLEEQRQQIAAEVRQAYLDYEAIASELEVARVQEEMAQRALDAAEQAYLVGTGTLVEVTQARADYVQAQSSLVQAQYDLIFQKRQIDYYVGAIDPEQKLFE